MSKERGKYAAMLLGSAKRKPSIGRVSKERLDAIDVTMRGLGCDGYDLGIVWSPVMFAWMLYAVVMFDQE